MDWVKICTYYYKAEYYDEIDLKVFVVNSKITETDYKNITGIDYVA